MSLFKNKKSADSQLRKINKKQNNTKSNVYLTHVYIDTVKHKLNVANFFLQGKKGAKFE